MHSIRKKLLNSLVALTLVLQMSGLSTFISTASASASDCIDDEIACEVVTTGTLTVKKHVVNDNGGTLSGDDFGFMIGNSTLDFGQGTTDGYTTTYSSAIGPVSGGDFTVSESGDDNYVAGDWVCDDGTTSDTLSVTVTLDTEDIVCEITNDDIAPKLTLNKILDGGDTSPSAWTLHAVGAASEPTSLEGPGADGDEDVVSGEDFMADTYTLSETGDVEGYTPGSWACTNGFEVVNDEITLGIGDETVCSITNTYQAPEEEEVVEATNPNIHVEKYGPETAEQGETVTYTFEVTNTGDTPLSDPEIGDSITDEPEYVSGDTNDNDILDMDETWLYEADYTIPEDQEKDVHNTVEVCAYEYTYLENNAGVISDDKEVCDKDYHCLDVIVPPIKVEKWSSIDQARAGNIVYYYFSIENTGDYDLDVLSVVDDIAGEGTYSYGDDGDWILEVGETWTFYAAYTVPEGQVEDIFNTVEICTTEFFEQDWEEVNPLRVQLLTDVQEEEPSEICATATHNLEILNPAIEVAKSGPSTAKAGEKATYTFTVTNAGDVPLTKITVVDSIIGSATYVSGDTNSDDVLDLDETWIYTANYVIPANQTADVVNTAKACGNEYFPRQEEGDVSRVQIIIDEQEPPRYCSSDTHTLKIPVTIVLSNTGMGISSGLYISGLILMVVGGLELSRKRAIK